MHIEIGGRMLKKWQDDLQGDPLPWLLEEENPSARYLTLRDLLDCSDYDSQASETRSAIPDWPPVREILALMDPVDFWGKAQKPFFGGAMSTHATLHLLAKLGMFLTPQIATACENLLEHGQHESGGFSDGTEDRVLFCHTGNAIQTLIHFGYQYDLRVTRAIEYLTERVTSYDGLECPYADSGTCQWGIAKVLGAFAMLPHKDIYPEHVQAITILADAVLSCSPDCEKQHADWLDFGFPLDYQSDLIELCEVLARLNYSADPRFHKLMTILLENQTNEGRWIKRGGTRALRVEQVGEPSKWITLRALRAIKYAQQGLVKATLVELNEVGA
jgi:hypothetical protein